MSLNRIWYALCLPLLCACGLIAQTLPQLTLGDAIVAGLSRPTSLTHAQDGSGRIFVTEQTGTIRIISKDGHVQEDPFLDISDRVTPIDPLCCDERGLLSVAFPPGFASSRRFYVYYTGEANEIRVSRFQVREDDPNRADPTSEEVVLRVEHKYENHFGGQLAFHPLDHKLYVSLGDGAGGGNPLRSSQDPENIFGKVWRWDVEGGATDLELYTLGLRNPWRFSFDKLTGDLYIGDVGDDTWEEVDYQPYGMVGANFGWSVLEGNQCFEDAECDKSAYRAPAAVYNHAEDGCSVTGGLVVRGGDYAPLQGAYLYADFCQGKIWGMVKSAEDESFTPELLFKEDGRTFSAFGEDEDGAVYVIDYLTGAVHRIGIADTAQTAPARQPLENYRAKEIPKPVV